MRIGHKWSAARTVLPHLPASLRSELAELLVEEGQRLLQRGPPGGRAGGSELALDTPPRQLEALTLLLDLSPLGRERLPSVLPRCGVFDLRFNGLAFPT